MLNKQKSAVGRKNNRKTIKVRSNSGHLGNMLSSDKGSENNGKQNIHPDYTKKVNR